MLKYFQHKEGIPGQMTLYLFPFHHIWKIVKYKENQERTKPKEASWTIT